MNKKAILEAAKELGRVLLFAAVGWAISYFSNLPENTTTMVALLVLRGLDKYLHENDNVRLNGIAPF